MTASFILQELLSVANPEKAMFLQGFFKTGKGQYAEGDVFLGLVVPHTRSIAKASKQTPLSELEILIQSEYHEARLCALLILVEQFKKASESERADIYTFYLNHTSQINNWDLVDISCPYIVGSFLLGKDRSRLYELAESNHLWSQRIAVVSTVAFIRKGEFMDTFALAEKLLIHEHDLMHKAVGWMLREVGKKDRASLTDFLERNASRMPRTALRYAIEHYPEAERKAFLSVKQIKNK